MLASKFISNYAHTRLQLGTSFSYPIKYLAPSQTLHVHSLDNHSPAYRIPAKITLDQTKKKSLTENGGQNKSIKCATRKLTPNPFTFVRARES